MPKVDIIKYTMNCKNWMEIAIPLATHKPPDKVILKKGVRFVSRSINWEDVYEIFYMEAYTPHYHPIVENDVVVDIGANIGVFTTYAASRTKNTDFAFESFPANFEAPKQNIRANELNNVRPFCMAVSDTSGTEPFFDSEESQQHRLEKVALGKTATYIEVPSVGLPGLMDQNHLERIDFLKMDCVRKMSMEFHDGASRLKHEQIQGLLDTSNRWESQSV